MYITVDGKFFLFYNNYLKSYLKYFFISNQLYKQFYENFYYYQYFAPIVTFLNVNRNKSVSNLEIITI